MSGVFGIYSQEEGANVAEMTYFALFALQHRGQESCGIAVCDKGFINNYRRDLGLVPEVFTPEALEKLGFGNMAIGQVQYGSSSQYKNRSMAQPLVVRHINGPMAIALSGSLTNSAELREELERSGAIFHSMSDAEVVAYLVTKARISTDSIEAALSEAIKHLKGAYSLIIMSPRKLVAARDPHGFRPLSVGTLKGDYLISSESCAIDCLGGDFLREIEAGELVVIENNQLRTVQKGRGKPTGLCLFEFIYFARQDTIIENISVHAARRKSGEFLAAEFPVEADIVIGVPESGLDAAIGYAQATKIPYGLGFTKNRYVGRTFIQPSLRARERAVDIKLKAIADTVKDRRVIMIDDSIVRGTTTGKIVKLVRAAGAKEVHVRISAPPFVYPCYFGTDVASKESLIASKMSREEICEHIGADSLAFLSTADALKITEKTGCGFCAACFTGEYPSIHIGR